MLKRLLFVVLLLVEAAAADPIHLGFYGMWGQLSPGDFVSASSVHLANFGEPFRGGKRMADPYFGAAGFWPILHQSSPAPTLLGFTVRTGYFSEPFALHVTAVIVAVTDRWFYLGGGIPEFGRGGIFLSFINFWPGARSPLWFDGGTAPLFSAPDPKMPEIPEPTTLLLLGSGFLATVARRVWR